MDERKKLILTPIDFYKFYTQGLIPTAKVWYLRSILEHNIRVLPSKGFTSAEQTYIKITKKWLQLSFEIGSTRMLCSRMDLKYHTLPPYGIISLVLKFWLTYAPQSIDGAMLIFALKADWPHPRYSHTHPDYRHTDKHLRLLMTLIALCCRASNINCCATEICPWPLTLTHDLDPTIPS